MKAILKRFGQEVDLEDPSKTIHTLVFDINGKILSVPVTEAAIQTLVKELFAPKKVEQKVEKVAAPVAEPEEHLTEDDLEHASEFGGDMVPEPSSPDPTACPGCGHPGYQPGTTCEQCYFSDCPSTEDEVPGL